MSKTSQRMKAKRENQLPKDRIIKLDDTGYWSAEHRWETSPIELATKVSRTRAESVRRSMMKIGYTQASIITLKG